MSSTYSDQYGSFGHIGYSGCYSISLSSPYYTKNGNTARDCIRFCQAHNRTYAAIDIRLVQLTHRI